ncbi:MAG TPA: alpha/beta hydrolase domain-containing protein [Thermoleophilaceae bacterium]|jgi:hypothetical protein
MRLQLRAIRGAAGCALAVSAALAAPAAGSVPTPSVEGPIPSTAQPGDPSHDYVFYSTPLDLRRAGYTENEYFISGTATRYPSNPADPLADATPIGTMPYKTRIVVRRPANPKRFKGVVVVDWQNVTAGQDIDTEWGASGDYFVRHGWAWVGASVQRVGVHGFAPPSPLAGRGLKQWNPTRYASLDVTNGGTVVDDSQSFDIYSQIAQLAKHPAHGAGPFKGLKVRRVYAGGVSQSARFLLLYYNTVQPLARVYDGFLPGLGGPRVRTDVRTRMLRVNTENDVWRGQGDPAIRIGDTRYVHTWEIAGGSHVPASAVSPDPNDFRAILGGIQTRDIGPQAPFDCVNPGPSDVEVWAVAHTAYDALDRWVTRGIAPPTAQPIEVNGMTGTTWNIVRDADGFAVGGIRLPSVTVPVALNNGENAPANLTNPLNAFCVLYGTHEPYSPEKLASLYRSHGSYVLRVAAAAARLVRQGFLLREDASTLVWRAIRADVP